MRVVQRATKIELEVRKILASRTDNDQFNQLSDAISLQVEKTS